MRKSAAGSLTDQDPRAHPRLHGLAAVGAQPRLTLHVTRSLVSLLPLPRDLYTDVRKVEIRNPDLVKVSSHL